MFEPTGRDHASANQEGSDQAADQSAVPAPEPSMSAINLDSNLIQARKPSNRTPRPIRDLSIVAAAAIGVVAAVIYLAISNSPGGHSATANVAGAVVNPSANVAGAVVNPTASAGAATPGPMPGAPTLRLSTGAGTAPLPVNSSNAPTPLLPTDPAHVAAWDSGQAGKSLAQVASLAGTVLMAHSTGEYAQMLEACKALSGPVKTARTLPPIPDAAMQSAYMKSLTDFEVGIAECETAITQHVEGVEDTVTHVNQSEMQQTVRQLGAGLSNLYLATEAIQKQ